MPASDVPHGKPVLLPGHAHVLVPGLALGESAWPTFREAACRIGVVGVFAFPLYAATERVLPQPWVRVLSQL